MLYIAKDGRRFRDPLECEDYEKTLDIINGSVGDLIRTLEEYDPYTYIFGTVLIKGAEGKGSTIYTRCTVNVDYLLEDYVNVENLSDVKRNCIATMGELADSLKKNEDKDAPCQYFIVFCNNLQFKKPGCLANFNRQAWSDSTKIE